MGRWVVIFVVVAWIVCMWCIVIYALVKGWGPYIRSRRQKPRSIRAQIVDKLGTQDIDPLEMRMEYTRKALVFACEDGEHREFEVHDDVWDWVEIGDTGELVYQGHIFIAWHADRPRWDPDKMLRRLMRG
ncbi:MAG: DUF2500 family protein [Armatimonadota bacterium]|nr:DUF2500 family protein [Armatimonadota bacterium]